MSERMLCGIFGFGAVTLRIASSESEAMMKWGLVYQTKKNRSDPHTKETCFISAQKANSKVSTVTDRDASLICAKFSYHGKRMSNWLSVFW